jgi:hypothetical protein
MRKAEEIKVNIEYEKIQEDQLKAFKIKELEKQNLSLARTMEAKHLRDKQLQLQN